MGVNADLLRLVDDAITICCDPRIAPNTSDHTSYYTSDPRHIYRSILPFLPPSSPVLAYYNKLSDPVRVLRVDGQINKLGTPPSTPLQSNNALTRNDAPITCATLSDDGHHVALGFRSGLVEVVDAELGVRVLRFSDGPPSPLVWLLFTDGGKLVTENLKGEICILDNITLFRVQYTSRLDGAENAITSLSHDGSMIVRITQYGEREWHEGASIIHITTEGLTVNALTPPPPATSLPIHLFPNISGQFYRYIAQ